MGQKVNPISMRLQVDKNWKSRWFANKQTYREYLLEDLKIRDIIESSYRQRAVIDSIDIERSTGNVTVNIHTPKAGVVIGKGGAGVNELRSKIEKTIKKPVRLNIEEVRKPELHAKIVAEEIARQLESRIAFRRAIKGSLGNVMRAGAKGIRIEVSGRLNGAEMSRTEKASDGSVPLHTLRADISYHLAEAQLTGAGIVGVKVWINRGDKV